MKFPNWKQVYANDPSNEEYDKKAKDIAEITIDSISKEDCIQNVITEKNLIFLSVAPITEEIQVVHHLTQIGGNTSFPKTMMVGLVGFGSSARPVRFDNNIFDEHVNINSPTINNMLKCATPKCIMDLGSPSTQNTTSFRSLIAIPPLLSLAVMSSPSYLPEELMVDCIVAIKAFDVLHKDDKEFPKASTACKRILQFLWAASHNLLELTISITQDSAHITKFNEDLHEKHILTGTLQNPNPSSVIGPSDATLSSLSGSIVHLTSHLEKDSSSRQSDKEANKNKFSKLPESSQSTILYASSINGSAERTIVNPEFAKLLEQTSISRARTHLNQVMASYGCQIDVCSILVASITAGDLIWTRSSLTPEKFTIFLMGKPSPTSSRLNQKDWLKMHLQETNQNQGFDNDVIEKLSAFKFDYPRDLSSLHHYINNKIGLCRIIFYGTSALTLSIASWCDVIDRKEMLFEMQFEVDPLFGLKVCLIIDRAAQLFLQSCQDATNFTDVDFTYLDFSFDQGCIERGRFSCNPPPPLLALFNATTPIGDWVDNNINKRRRTNALSGVRREEGQDTQNFVQNEEKNDKWIVADRNEYVKAFPPSIWTSDPPPKLNDGDLFCCPRLNGRGYCFKDCKRSHDSMNTATSKKYDIWQKKRRDKAK